MRKYVIIAFLALMLIPAISVASQNFNNSISTKVYPPEIVYVIAHLPSENVTINNGSIVETCTEFNITINATDDKGITYINVSYLSHLETIDGGNNFVVVAEVSISFSGPTAFTVTITVQDADGFLVSYVFYVVCPDNSPPSVDVTIGNQQIRPGEVYYTCENTTIHISVYSPDGIDLVIVTITHSSSVVYTSTFDLSEGTVDTSFARDIELSIVLGGLYTINIYVKDLSGNEELYTYYIMCPQGDQPPEIVLVNTTKCGNTYVPFGGCLCCCDTTISVLIVDDLGVRSVRTFIDGTLVSERTVDSPTPYYRYTIPISVSSEGIHQVEIYAYDVASNYDYFMFYLVCDVRPPNITVQVNGTSIINESLIEASSDVFELKVTITDNVGFGTVRLLSNGELIIEDNYRSCPPNLTEYAISRSMNFTDAHRASGGLIYFPSLIIRLTHTITIIAEDYCGNKAIFIFTLYQDISVMPEPQKIMLAPTGIAIMVGIGAASAIATTLAYNLFLRRKQEA